MYEDAITVARIKSSLSLDKNDNDFNSEFIKFHYKHIKLSNRGLFSDKIKISVPDGMNESPLENCYLFNYILNESINSKIFLECAEVPSAILIAENDKSNNFINFKENVLENRDAIVNNCRFELLETIDSDLYSAYCFREINNDKTIDNLFHIVFQKKISEDIYTGHICCENKFSDELKKLFVYIINSIDLLD